MKKLVSLMVLGAAGTLFAANVNLASCKGCHGAKFEKSALGKSKIVANLTEEEIANSLIGYKNGTYGGPMKGIMKGQVARYSDEELKASVAEILKVAGK